MMTIAQLYQEWLKADLLEGNGQCTIFAGRLLSALHIYGVVTTDEVALVEHEILRDAQNLKLFLDIMPAKGEQGLILLSQILKKKNKLHLESLKKVSHGTSFEKMLKEGMKRSQLIFKVPSAIKLRNVFDGNTTILFLSQRHLENYLKINCEYIARFWKDILPHYNMSNAYVGLELLTNTGNKTGINIACYQDIFQSKEDKKKRFKRIIIEADPGCGKSTYINKLALDWANGDKYLRSIFDFVFVFELKHLTSIVDGFECFLPPECHDFAKAQLDKAKNKVLIILDGFDEMEQSGNTFDDIQSILKLEFYSSVTCILTTRRNHMDKIPPAAKDLRIVITGFSRKSVDAFIQKQEGCPLPTFEERKVVGTLLQTPLFCAIYCYMKIFSPQTELVNFYDLIESLVKSWTAVHMKKMEQSTEEYSTLDLQRDSVAIGKFAIYQLDDISKTVIRKIEATLLSNNADHSQLKNVRLGLLIKRKCPTSRYLEFLDEYSFPHQLIAEYFAAQYFATCVAVEEIDPQLLADKIFLKQPFVQFLLRMIFDKWSTKSRKEKYVENFLLQPNIFWTWVCALPKVVLSPMIIVRIHLSADDNKVDIVEDMPKHIFEVYMKDSSITKWKPDWWYTIEKRMKSKKEDVIVIANWTNDLVQSTMIGCLESYRMWNIFQLTTNESEDLNLNHKTLSEVSLPEENIRDQGTFCSDLNQCGNLRTLNLAKCHLNIDVIFNLLESMRLNKFPHLENLNLSHNQNIEQQDVTLFLKIAKCTNLQSLQMQNCKINADALNSFVEQVNNDSFRNLQTIDLADNERIGTNAQFFKALTKLSWIKHLNLNNCNISIQSAQAFVDGTTPRFLQLESLNLSGNVKITQIDNFLQSLTSFCKLASLELKDCLTGQSVKSFAEQFSSDNPQNLQTLDVTHASGLGRDGHFFTALLLCKNLRVLKMGCINLTCDSLLIFVGGIKSKLFETLEYLYLNENEAVGNLEELFVSFSYVNNLKLLDLARCKITASSLRAFTGTVLRSNMMASLESINFQYNDKIGGEVSFFVALLECKSLKDVDFAGCLLTGSTRNNLKLLEQRGCNVVYDKERIRSSKMMADAHREILKSVDF